MELEVISHYPKGRAHETPLVFVHGAYAGAWTWEPHFLPYFAQNGYEAHAVSLRGHAGSDGHESLPFARLSDYVDDVERVMDTLDAPPVLIGHSMGGMVVQKILHRRRVPGAVLMASAPPHGLLTSWISMSLFHPHVLMQLWLAQMFGPRAVNLQILKRALFSDGLSDQDALRYVPRFEAESVMVILDMLALDLPPSTRRLDLPVLVLGAGNDVFIPRGAVDQTARTYGTRSEFFPESAHALMLDPRWLAVAERVRDWLSESVGGSQRSGPLAAAA